MNDRIKEALDKFAAQSKDIAILYGGDGTLVGEWRKFRTRKGGKPILPVRNYGLCQKHQDFYMKFFTTKDEDSGKEEDISVKQFLFPVLRGEFKDKGLDNCLDALSELTVTSADPTQALRFTVKINGKLFGENIIGDGFIVSTKLGSTGYYKSITRTMFVEGIGIGFINPVYSIPNVICKQSDTIEFELIRSSTIIITADKLKQEIDALNGWKIIFRDSCENISILGYDHFMCQKCRNNRNSSYINDTYSIN